MKKLILILAIFTALQSQAQIKSVVIGEKAYYRTEPDEVVFLKRSNVYYLYLECDGSRDTSIKYTEIKFEGATIRDSSYIEINREKYVLTYNYSTLIKMDQNLINLFLNSELKSFRIGPGTKTLNTNKYKSVLIKLIEK